MNTLTVARLFHGFPFSGLRIFDLEFSVFSFCLDLNQVYPPSSGRSLSQPVPSHKNWHFLKNMASPFQCPHWHKSRLGLSGDGGC